MAATQFEHAEFEHAEQARHALRTVVAEHGSAVLTDPRALSNLLADLLPESPAIARIMVAAAQDKIADELRQHTTDGMDAATAARLATSSFASATMINPTACAWVVDEFALALGLVSGPAPSLTARLAGVEPPTIPPTQPNEPPSAPSPEALLARADTQSREIQPAPAPLQPAPELSVSTETTGHPESTPAAQPAEPPSEQPPTGTAPLWRVVATADRAYFDAVLADGELEMASIQFPGDYQPHSYPLSGPELRIGRRSRSRGLEPEIDLAGPPADPGISHAHATLVANQDGTWSVTDQGSANGTQVNGHEVTPGIPVRLSDGDRVCLGAWTVLTVHAQT
jgi:FHA domain